MTQEEKMKCLQGMFQGANMQNAQINLFVEPGAKVVYKEELTSKNDIPQVSDEQMAKIVEECQSLFWAQSSWAVFYCVCRDYLGMTYNMTEIEHYIWGLPLNRQLVFGCPEGTIQSTLKNNPYMKLPISKWKSNGAKERVLLLAEKLIAKLEEK